MRRVPGQDVRPARTVRVEQPLARRQARLDRQHILRRGRRNGAALLLVPPPERRNVLVRPEQEAGLSSARLRGPVRLPPHEMM